MKAFLSTAAVCDASAGDPVVPAVQALGEWCRISGPAFTVRTPPGDNLWIHRALAAAPRGSVLVVSAGGGECGHWGELMTLEAIRRRVAGLVLDGCVRDLRKIRRLRYPVFATGTSPGGTTKCADADGSLGEPVSLGGVVVEPGDTVVGDEDGVVVVGRRKSEDVLSRARRREERERQIADRIRQGEPLAALLGLTFP